MKQIFQDFTNHYPLATLLSMIIFGINSLSRRKIFGFMPGLARLSNGYTNTTEGG